MHARSTDGASRTKTPGWKLLLAGIGLAYAVGFGAWGVYALVTQPWERSATDLAAHPERENEVLADRRARDLQSELGLTDRQTEEVSEILLAFREQHLVSAPETSAAPWERMQSRMQAAQDTRAALEAVLTEEQRAEFAQMRLPWTPPMPGMGGPGRGGPPRRMLQAAGIDPAELEGMSPEERREFVMERMRERGVDFRHMGPPGFDGRGRRGFGRGGADGPAGTRARGDDR